MTGSVDPNGQYRKIASRSMVCSRTEGVPGTGSQEASHAGSRSGAQLFPAASTAGIQDPAASLCCHASTKSVAPLADRVRRLESAFGHLSSPIRPRNRACMFHGPANRQIMSSCQRPSDDSIAEVSNGSPGRNLVAGTLLVARPHSHFQVVGSLLVRRRFGIAEVQHEGFPPFVPTMSVGSDVGRS